MSAVATTLDLVTHTYSNGNGERLPLSVSKVLQESGIAPAYPPEAMAYVEEAREKGSACHEWCDYIDRGGRDLALLDEELLPYILGYQRFRADHKPDWEFIELSFHRDDCGGTPDRIGTIGKEPVILDIKTPKKIAKHWQIQLSAYQWITAEHAHKREAQWKPKLYVVLLSNDAMYRLLPYEADIPTWEAALQIARWKLK